MKKRIKQYLEGLITKDELFDHLQDSDIHTEPYYDYANQAWTIEGVYLPCNHPESLNCHCYGKVFAGKPTADNAKFYSDC